MSSLGFFLILIVLNCLVDVSGEIILENASLRVHQQLTRTKKSFPTLTLDIQFKYNNEKVFEAIDLERIDDNLCSVSKDLMYVVEDTEEFVGSICSTFISRENNVVLVFENNHIDEESLISMEYTGLILMESKPYSLSSDVGEFEMNVDEVETLFDGCDILEMNKSFSKRKLNSIEYMRDSQLWNNCYEGVEVPNKVKIGIAIGPALLKFLGSKNKARKYVETIVAEVNLIYARQLNIYFSVTHINFYKDDHCASKTTDILIRFADHAAGLKPRALWHLFDKCERVQGDAIGAAVSNSLCSDFGNTAVSIVGNSEAFLTVAHEFGHNFGAGHSFEEGRGSTGGIMDYGNGKLDDKYQFNSKYRRQEICHFLTEIKTSSQCENNNVNLFVRAPQKDIENSCGNGIVESHFDEECECANGLRCQCCDNCKLRENAQCEPSLNECCDANCQHKPTNSENLCSLESVFDVDKLGYCSNGECLDNFCSISGLEFCGINKQNSCSLKCRRLSDSPTSCPTTNWIHGNERNNVVEGSICTNSDGSAGQCSGGVCIGNHVENTPTVEPTISIVHFPTSAPVASRIPTSPPTLATDGTSSPTVAEIVFFRRSQDLELGNFLAYLGIAIILFLLVFCSIFYKVLQKRDTNHYWKSKAEGRKNVGLLDKLANVRREPRTIMQVMGSAKQLSDTHVTVLTTPHRLFRTEEARIDSVRKFKKNKSMLVNDASL